MDPVTLFDVGLICGICSHIDKCQDLVWKEALRGWYFWSTACTTSPSRYRLPSWISSLLSCFGVTNLNIIILRTFSRATDNSGYRHVSPGCGSIESSFSGISKSWYDTNQLSVPLRCKSIRKTSTQDSHPG
jgi:hypothetical protein